MKKKKPGLSAASLKSVLWQTLGDVKNKRISPQVATAVAIQSREILRIVRAELDIAKMCGERPESLIEFKKRIAAGE